LTTSKVLVVDDEPQILSLVKATLELGGLNVITADNAQQALCIVAQQACEIALVLSDVRMPGMSGPQLVREVAERSPSTAIALMSGELGQEILDSRIPFIQKPFRSSVLLKTVQELLA
jgi:DNA-binding NtrC family response regulator